MFLVQLRPLIWPVFQFAIISLCFFFTRQKELFFLTQLKTQISKLSLGKICGYDTGYSGYDLLYFPIPKSGYYNKGLCVSECPPENGSTGEVASGSSSVCKPNNYYTDCVFTHTDMSTIITKLDSGPINDPGDNLGYPTTSCKFISLIKV